MWRYNFYRGLHGSPWESSVDGLNLYLFLWGVSFFVYQRDVFMPGFGGKQASPNKKIKTFINGLLCSRFNCWCRCLSAYIYCRCMASLVTQTVKCLPAMWETRVWFLGKEDPLEKEMAAHSNILAWKIPWTKEPGRLQFMGSQKIGHDWALPFTSDVGQLFTICCCTERTGYEIICIVWWDFCNTHLYA